MQQHGVPMQQQGVPIPQQGVPIVRGQRLERLERLAERTPSRARMLTYSHAGMLVCCCEQVPGSLCCTPLLRAAAVAVY